jgi:6,7-dimethyl-8-ribityllumazine synthase
MKIDSRDPVVLGQAPVLDASKVSVALVMARFNAPIVAQLRDGAAAAWRRHGGQEDRFIERRVPGAYELPLACRELALCGKFSAVVALGCVIRGDTPHFDYVAGECARGLMNVGLETGVPVIFGVLTVETPAQAAERADPARLDKGGEALEAALEMAQLLQEIRR